jgi:Glycosyl hydrolase family 59.
VALALWKSNETAQLVREADVHVDVDGTFSLALEADAMYSLTTTAGQGGVRPMGPVPASSPFPFPYADDFDSYDANRYYPYYFSDIAGIFTLNDTPRAPQTWRPEGAGSGAGILHYVFTEQPDLMDGEQGPCDLYRRLS